MTVEIAALLAAVVLAAIHWGAKYLGVLDTIPRSAWLSAASGVSVAYVFVHLLPELASVQAEIADEGGPLPSLERHTWILALLGLVLFYGLEQHAERTKDRTSSPTTTDRVGRLHVFSYASYNVLVGYLLVEQARQEDRSLALFTIAIGLHFVVNDHGLRDDHGHVYDHLGRVLLPAAILLGWGVSMVVELPEVAIGFPVAFLAGSIVLNVLKEELPSERQSRLAPFVGGAAAYTALLLIV